MTAKKVSAKKAPVKRQVSGKNPHKKNVDEIMTRVMAEIGYTAEETLTEFKFTQPTSSKSKFKIPTPHLRNFNVSTLRRPKLKFPVLQLPKIKLPTLRRPKLKMPVLHLPKIKLPTVRIPKLKFPDRPAKGATEPDTTKQSLPLVVVAAVVALIIAGFWGPQIARALGIPIDPKPYTAIYFQDPKIVETGIVAGDLIIFGVHNGFREDRNLDWRMVSGTAPLTSGQVTVKAHEDSQLAVSTSGAIPGQLLKIYIEETSAPITIQVVG